MLKNIFAVLKNPNSFIVWFLSSFLAITLWYAYSDIEYVAGNYQSHTFAYFDMILSWIMVLLLPLMIAGIVYRSLYFGIYRATERKVGFLGIFGGIIGLFIT